MFISTNNRENWERPMDIGHRLRVLRENLSKKSENETTSPLSYRRSSR